MQSRRSLDTPLHTQRVSSARTGGLIKKNATQLMDTPHTTQLSNLRGLHLATHGFNLSDHQGGLIEGHAKTATLFAPTLLQCTVDRVMPQKAGPVTRTRARTQRQATFPCGAAIDPNHPLPHIASVR